MRPLRVIVAAHALWIVLSNPALPSVVAWPRAFWNPIPRNLLLRFGYFGLHETLEWILFALMIVCLVAVVFGIAMRVTAFAAGLLLYHFAPLDSLLAWGDFIQMGGLTVATLAMFAMWAAGEDESAEWPLVFSRLLIGMSFLLSGTTKLREVGPRWYSGSMIEQMALTNWSLSGRTGALWIASHPAAAWAVGIGSALLDVLFIFAVFSKPVRWIVIPLAIAGLVVRSLAFGIHWLAAPLLLLFVAGERPPRAQSAAETAALQR